MNFRNQKRESEIGWLHFIVIICTNSDIMSGLLTFQILLVGVIKNIVQCSSMKIQLEPHV